MYGEREEASGLTGCVQGGDEQQQATIRSGLTGGRQIFRNSLQKQSEGRSGKLQGGPPHFGPWENRGVSTFVGT